MASVMGGRVFQTWCDDGRPHVASLCDGCLLERWQVSPAVWQRVRSAASVQVAAALVAEGVADAVGSGDRVHVVDRNRCEAARQGWQRPVDQALGALFGDAGLMESAEGRHAMEAGAGSLAVAKVLGEQVLSVSSREVADVRASSEEVHQRVGGVVSVWVDRLASQSSDIAGGGDVDRVVVDLIREGGVMRVFCQRTGETFFEDRTFSETFDFARWEDITCGITPAGA